MSSVAGGACDKGHAGPFGHVDCDPTPSEWRRALGMMVRQQPAPDFLVAGGDWFGHVDESRRTEAAVTDAAVILARMVEEHFGRVPVVHAIGNHESVSQPTQPSGRAGCSIRRAHLQVTTTRGRTTRRPPPPPRGTPRGGARTRGAPSPAPRARSGCEVGTTRGV